jgi:hypothetical protein
MFKTGVAMLDGPMVCALVALETVVNTVIPAYAGVGNAAGPRDHSTIDAIVIGYRTFLVNAWAFFSSVCILIN